MLLLTRKPQQRIMIGDKYILEALSIGRDRIVLDLNGTRHNMKVGYKLLIESDITVGVQRILHGQVQFGIDAPKSVPVHREEVAARIKAEQAAVSL